MNNMNTEEKESRKKFLVPLVVLLLCAVAFTGAAYAYSSTLTVDDNNVNVKTLTVDLKTGTPADDIDVETDNFVAFTDQYKYPAIGYKTNAVKCDVDTQHAFTVNLKISGDAPANKLYVYSDNIGLFLDTGVGSKKISNLFKIYVTDKPDATADTIESVGKEIKGTKAASEAFTIVKSADSDPIDEVVYIWMVAVSENSVEVQEATPTQKDEGGVDVPNTDCKYASYFATILKNADLHLTFEAEQVST